MSYITAIGTANPKNRFSQSLIAGFMLRTMDLQNGDAQKLRAIFRASGIAFRHSVVEDYGREKDFTFFPATTDLEPFPSTEKRLQIFKQHALALSVSSFQDMARTYEGVNAREITHLIVVCCTGMYAPGLDIDLVQALNLSTNVQRTAINFMGCHASFNAMKVADAVCKSNPEARVLVICTELCSLHFQRAASEDNLLANALFGDGSASMLIDARKGHNFNLKIENFHNDLAPNGQSEMAWTIGNAGFEMRLSSFVPDLIRDGVGDLVKGLLKKVSVELSAIQHFAVHPGGKKILQVVEEVLPISREMNQAAYHVLRNFGNMSSPTVLFVLKEIMRKLNHTSAGERILSLAFGPGLTLEGMVLYIENPTENA